MGERGYGDGFTLYAWLSSIALLPWLPGFPPQAFPTRILSLTSPRSSLHSQQQPSPWGCSTVPKLQLSAGTPSWGPAFLSRVCMTAAGTVWFSFCLGGHRSAVSPSLKCDSDSCPNVGIGLLLQFSHQLRAGPVLPRLLFFPFVPSSYGVLCGSYILFHWSGTPFDSDDVLHALLCLKVYSWYIYEKGYTPHLPTPSPSCSLIWAIFKSCPVSIYLSIPPNKWVFKNIICGLKRL